MPCPARCPCCEAHTIREQHLQDAVLEEINLYRTLLRMEPLTSIAAFLTPLQPSTPDIPQPVSPQFECMPSEILDQIASFVDGDSILTLCHSVPYFKYISKAMLDVADPLRYDRLNFWPHYTLPTAIWTIEYPLSGNIDFRNRHLFALSVYSHIVSRHSGSATVACSKGFDNVVGALPDSLRVVIGDVKTGSGLSHFLSLVKESKKKLVHLEFEFEKHFDAHRIVRNLIFLSPKELKLYGAVPSQILNELPNITGLSVLYLARLDERSMEIIAQCVDLEELEIRSLQFSKNLQVILPRFMTDIKKGRIRKLSYLIHHRGNNNDLEADASWVDSFFVEHGWHEEGERRDYRIFQRSIK
ncbi:hypothetical protein BJ741DRAFT_636773 [Chytriomyces cf. hyalinus JEL632]|nr:hypothetical protein BJ741DRAFT_636773 [Chytriomyces cf. hyalinus JEL632]